METERSRKPCTLCAWKSVVKRNDRTVIGIVDILADGVGLEGADKRLNLLGVFVAFLHGDDVHIGLCRVGVGLFIGKRILCHGEAGIERVVAVENHIGDLVLHTRNLRRFEFENLHVVGVFLNVQNRCGQTRAVLELENTVVLQEKKRARFVGGIVRNSDGVALGDVIQRRSNETPVHADL